MLNSQLSIWSNSEIQELMRELSVTHGVDLKLFNALLNLEVSTYGMIKARGIKNKLKNEIEQFVVSSKESK